VRLRAYGQHDPLVEYRRESNMMYKEMVANFEKWMEENKDKFSKQESVNRNQETENLVSHSSVDIKSHKLGRNDPCYCGSGKKFKKCHGK